RARARGGQRLGSGRSQYARGEHQAAYAGGGDRNVGGADRAAAQACDGAGIPWRVHRGRSAVVGRGRTPAPHVAHPDATLTARRIGVGLRFLPGRRGERRLKAPFGQFYALGLGWSLIRPRARRAYNSGKRLFETLLLSTTSCACSEALTHRWGHGPPPSQARRAVVKAIFAAKNRANTEV